MTYTSPSARASKLLPLEARELLQRTVKEHQKSSEFDRQKALDAAIRRVKTMYPEYFETEKE